MTSSRFSSSIAIGVGATVATPLDGAPSERWRAIASSSESPARTAVGQAATAIHPRPSRLRPSAMTGLLRWRPTPTARDLPARSGRGGSGIETENWLALRDHARNLGSGSSRCPDSRPWVQGSVAVGPSTSPLMLGRWNTWSLITASARSERQGPRQAECLSHLPERPCLLSRAARRGSERPRLDVYRSKVLPPVAVHPCCGLPSSSWIRTALTIVTSEAHEPGCERCQNGSIAVRHLRRSPSMREAVAASSAFMKTRSWSIFSSQAMRVAALDLKRIIEPCISHDVMRRLHPAKPATRPDARVGTR